MSTQPNRYTFRRWAWTYYPGPEWEKPVYEFIASFGEDVLPTKPDTYDTHITSLCQFDSPKHRFSIYQLESCPTTERLHYQGYSEFTQPVTMTAIKKLFNLPGIHLEPAVSDQEKNFKYCTKEGRVFGPYMHGTPAVVQGSRTDLHAVYELVPQAATGRAMMAILGPAGMRHLNLYQRAVRCYLKNDADDNAIREGRRNLRKKNAKKKGLPTPPDTASDDSDEEFQ